MHSKITSIVIIAVLAVWIVNFTAPLFIQHYKPAPEINLAFMAIIGILTAKGAKKSEKSKDGDEDASN